MDYGLIFLFIDKHNCFSLINTIYKEPYKDNPTMLKQLLDVLEKCCNDFNYKKNLGNLNIEGLCRFICHEIMDNNENMRLFNEYMENVAAGKVRII